MFNTTKPAAFRPPAPQNKERTNNCQDALASRKAAAGVEPTCFLRNPFTLALSTSAAKFLFFFLITLCHENTLLANFCRVFEVKVKHIFYDKIQRMLGNLIAEMNLAIYKNIINNMYFIQTQVHHCACRFDIY